MNPPRNQLHLSEGEDESEEEEESYGHALQQLQQCYEKCTSIQLSSKFTRRKGPMQEGFNKEMQRVKLKRGKGAVIHVNGGRIVRSTGRKDRHSKVCTARGTRDRRVRLSPNTAIQFYDVQDRLGYDRPSKAIDWLMKEAKAEIDALNAATALGQADHHLEQQGLKDQSSDQSGIQKHQPLDESSNPNFLLFSMENAVKEPSPTDFQSNCLSFQDDSPSILFFDDQQGLFPALHSNAEMESSKIQRLISWNANPENGKIEEESFTNLTPHYFPPVIGQNQVFSQREPLQSSFFPPLCTHSFSYATMGFANNEFSGLPTTRRIHGEHEEEHNPTSGRPTTGTSLLDYQQQ